MVAVCGLFVFISFFLLLALGFFGLHLGRVSVLTQDHKDDLATLHFYPGRGSLSGNHSFEDGIFYRDAGFGHF